MTIKVSVSGSGQVNVVGNDYNDLKEPVSFSKAVGPFTTANANNAALGANECYSAITTIPAGGTATVNLQSLQDICLQSGLLFVRLKAYLIRLLSVSDDATSGTACSGVTINASGTNLNALNGLSSYALGNGEFLCWATPNAAGITVDGTHFNLEFTNNDVAHAAAVQITLIGGTS